MEFLQPEALVLLLLPNFSTEPSATISLFWGPVCALSVKVLIFLDKNEETPVRCEEFRWKAAPFAPEVSPELAAVFRGLLWTGREGLRGGNDLSPETGVCRKIKGTVNSFKCLTICFCVFYRLIRAITMCCMLTISNCSNKLFIVLFLKFIHSKISN